MHGSEARKRVTETRQIPFIKVRVFVASTFKNVIFEFQEYGESAEEGLLTSNK